MSARSALAETLQDALPDVLVLPTLAGVLASVPAVVIRRGQADVDAFMGQSGRDGNWDLVLLVGAGRPDSSDLLEELIDRVIDALRDRPDLDGAVGLALPKQVGEEEIAEVDGQDFLSSVVRVEVTS